MDIQKLYTESLKDQETSTQYLQTRKLTNPNTIGTLFNKGKAHITIPIYNTLQELIALELRDINTKQYIKLTDNDYNGYMIYNIQNAIKEQDYVILTEGVFDAMSLIQSGINAISGLRASVPEAILHFLPFWDKIYIAFDNDDVGNEQTNKITSFIKKHYDRIVIPIDYYSHDINDALINNEMKYIKEQICK